jgi:hypothetical protein
MAKPATTHVLEIETGIGEPAFIPLTLGQELQPISVGKKGMWRIESPRVLDVHAFVYFDGNALFLQSADEKTAASVDGFKIGKAWTELHAPCKIEIGGARLRYRSLLPSTAEDVATTALVKPPVQAPPGAGPPLPGGGLPVDGGGTMAMPPGQRPVPNPRAIPSMPPAAGAPPPQVASQPPAPLATSAMPASFPKDARPFKPGEFSRGGKDDDESTRIAPIDTSAARTGVSAVLARPADPMTRPEGVPLLPGSAPPLPQMPSTASGAYGQVVAPDPSAPNMPGLTPPPGAMPPPMMPPGGFQGTGPYPMQPGMPPPGMNPGMPSMPPGGYGTMTPHQGQPPIPQQVGFARFVAEFKAFSGPKKVLVFLMPIALLGAVFILFTDDPPPPKQATRADGGVEGGVVAASSAGKGPATPSYTLAPTAQQWPPSVPCPPAGWPPNEPLPCIPPGYTPPATATAAATTPPAIDVGGGAGTAAPPGKDGGAEPKEKDAGAEPKEKPPRGQKTLERQAVDLVAAGRFAEAAAVYDQLAQQQQQRDPKNTDPTYREAARILRSKLDGGAP